MTTIQPKFSPSRRSFLKGTGAMLAGLTFMPRFSLSPGGEEAQPL